MAARKTKAAARPVAAKSKPRTPLIADDSAPPGKRKGANLPTRRRSRIGRYGRDDAIRRATVRRFEMDSGALNRTAVPSNR
jgi:hypothetical protein